MTDMQAESAVLATFGQVLQAIEGGRLDHDLADSLRELVAEVQNQGGEGKASLTLTLDFTFKDGIVDVVPAIKSKLPPRPRGRTVMWVTPGNRLTRANPNQMGLPLRDVNAPADTRAV